MMMRQRSLGRKTSRFWITPLQGNKAFDETAMSCVAQFLTSASLRENYSIRMLPYESLLALNV
jgi:hypothetical protein